MSNPDFSHQLVMPFTDGVYIAANAISDCILIVDSPSCGAYKAERVYGNHDWLSTLSTPTQSRLFQSNLNITDLSMGREHGLVRAFKQTMNTKEKRLVLLTAISLVTVTGKQYVHLLDEFEDELGVPIVEVPSRDLYADWVEGYADTLKSLARNLELPKVKTDKKKVAVVGFLWDRYEGDVAANLDIVTNMIKAFGLDPVSVWLSGGTVAELQRASEAGTIISLPYGKKAAKLLARKTGAKLIECPLPAGPANTAEFLTILGDYTDNSNLSKALIKDGLSTTLPGFAFPTPEHISGKRFALMLDPHFMEGVVDSLTFLGAEPAALFCPTRQIHVAEDWANRFEIPVHFNPTVQTVQNEIQKAQAEDGLDICIGETSFLSFIKPFNTSIMELGFPSFYTHHLTPSPTYGYAGFSGLIERFVNTLTHDHFKGFGR